MQSFRKYNISSEGNDISQNDLCLFYVACVRSVIDYAAPVFPAYLMQELERAQKRAMRIICPGIEYQHTLALVNLPTVAKHHNDICRRTFESICNDSGSKLKKLFSVASLTAPLS